MSLNFIGEFIDHIAGGLKGGSYLPVIIGVILAVAFIAMLLVTIFTLVSIKRAELKAKKVINLPPSALQGNTPPHKEEVKDDPNATTPPPIGEWLNKFLINKGYISVNSIVRSFFKAMEFLKDSLGVGYKYKLPWYMILGTEESGKSSLISGFTHDEIFDDEKDDAALTWWFLKNGVVLDVKGSVFLPREGFNADDKSWNVILNMLSRYRSQKPINGIILAIPADELYGKNKKPIEEIKSRAQYIARKLNFAQNYLGMKLPVYIVVTKTDTVPGFQSFCSEIPVRNRSNMLGWSSPYSIDTLYSSQILDEGFASLEDELNEIRMEIFSESTVTTTRDGVFVFPSELLTIKDPLGCYIDTIFKASSIDDRFYFRGFYFTGDSKMVPLLQFDNSDQSTDTMAIMGTPDADINEAGNVVVSFRNEAYTPKKIFFFEDLLLKKVFMEDGLATPMKSKIHQSNKAIFIAKISTAAFVVIGSYGLFNAKDNFKLNKDNLYPSLFKISSLVKNAGDLTFKNLEDNGSEVLGECTNQLLSMMQQLNNARFSSIFVPVSWFSSINQDLTETLRISYQRVVVRTIYMNLLLKAKALLNLKPIHESNSISEVLNPHNSKEYLLLKSYVNGLSTLEKNIKKFDSLRTSADPKDLSDLIDYTFQGSLPKEFLDNYQQFRSILMNTPFPPIDLSPYKKVAYDVLISLFQNYLDTIFTTRSENSIVSCLNKFIDQLIKQNINEIPDIHNVVKFSKDLTTVCKELGEEGKTWLDKDVFESDKEYEKFLDEVEDLFGKETAQQLLDITAVNFGYLKSRLEEFNNALKGDIPNKNIRKIVKAKDKTPTPSSGIFLMERCLGSLCSEKYMEIPEDYHIVTDIPEGKMIFWDDELVQYAYDMGKSFEQFFSTNIKDFPRVMQDGITLLTKSNLCAVVASTIAKAQSFVDAPNGLTSALTSEELLQKQVAELKDVGQKFVSLLQILKDDKLSYIFGDLRTILNKVGFSLLGHVDSLLENQKPYYPNNLKFDYWQGDIGSGLLAYSAADSEEMDLYLQLQRKLMLRLAKEFAEPIVGFLNAPIIYDKNYANLGQLTKWTRIVQSVQALDKKDPTSSVTVLERFVKRTLNEYTLDNITTKILPKDIKGDSGDYFTNIVKDIKKGIMSRAEILLRKRNIGRYQVLRDYYVKHLEKAYPFNNYDKSQRTSTDADLDAVKEFFKMYDEFGGTPEAILDQIYQLGEDPKPCYEFLKKIHDIRLFFADFFDSKYESMKVRLEIDFGVNKREETNTDYLVDRIFKPNNEANIESINADKSATWYFGEPIEMMFRWANGDAAAHKPVEDQNNPDLLLDEKSARIQCVGDWSVLRFLQKYKADTANVDEATQNQNILCFKIPLDNGKISKIYAGVTASIPKRPGDASIVSLKVPKTTGKMPEMPKSVVSLSNEAVLVSRVTSDSFESSYQEPQDDTIITTENAVLEDDAPKNEKPKNKSSKPKKKPVTKAEKKNQEDAAKTKEKAVDVLKSDDVPTINEGDSVIEVKSEPIG